MTNVKKARWAHDVLDGLSAGRILSRENEQLLRSFLPERPKRISLEALRHDVHDVWAGVHGNEWPDDMYCDLETWLAELHQQLQGLKDTPAAVPALPAGMRIADHKEYGRVVVSPGYTGRRVALFIALEKDNASGAMWDYAREDEFTFIDPEPAKPAHPEFLETEADYRDAPEGTIVASDENLPCHKFQSRWSSVAFIEMEDDKAMSRFSRRVLRWGWDK